MRIVRLALLCIVLAGSALADSTVSTPGGGGGASSVSELGDDIACGSNEFVKRNAADNGWECAAGAVGGDALTTSGLIIRTERAIRGWRVTQPSVASTPR